MISVVKAASYIYFRYMEENESVAIDEMKLHKLLYFSQREAIIRTGAPMFEDMFQAWKYGPVMVEIRNRYRTSTLNDMPTEEELAPYQSSFDYVFANYAIKDSWSLSMLSHGESSWQKAREGYEQDAHCDVFIKTEDIKNDAERIKLRRFYFNELLPQLETQK